MLFAHLCLVPEILVYSPFSDVQQLTSGITSNSSPQSGSSTGTQSKHKPYTYPAGLSPEELKTNKDIEKGGGEGGVNNEAVEWEDEPVEHAQKAIAAPRHREHIKEHLQEVLEAVNSMEQRSDGLFQVCVIIRNVSNHRYLSNYRYLLN